MEYVHWFNTERLHSSIEMLLPAVYEARFWADKADSRQMSQDRAAVTRSAARNAAPTAQNTLRTEAMPAICSTTR